MPASLNGTKDLILKSIVMNIRTISNYSEAEPVRELPTGPSLTIPGRALSIGEICRRSVIGAQVPNLAFNHPYDQGIDESFEDAFDNDFDLIDSLESKENAGYIYDRIVEQERAKKSKDSERVSTNSPDSVSHSETEPESKEEKLFE